MEVICKMAVERVREGESPSAVVAAYGFCWTNIYKWLKAASPYGAGLEAKPLDGRPRKLSPRQEKLVFRWVNGREPRQYGMDFGLWRRSVVARLIEEQFNVKLGLTAV